jgi:hypothetical protein
MDGQHRFRWIESFRWSSHADNLNPGSQRPSWLRVDRLLGEKRIPKDSAAGRSEFAKDMESGGPKT